ncbi:PIR protein, putative [Plasmodium sp. gorilla clade G1]|nr:PIR protein, putative [Plasmodium sp. gorilla clade G1]
MKVHYIYILLFALPLNILVYNQRNHNNTTSHTPKIPTTRLLCECELYAPANYDNDQDMKEVMQRFEDRTSQRFHEYDERIKTTRQKCKDKCDKEIQKIILKDKLEKELTEKFATLQTDIHSDAIPTCICEMSMANKVEKAYFKCTQNLGGIVTPFSGVLGGIAEGALYAWKPTAITAAKKAALAEATDAAIEAGMNAVSLKIKGLLDFYSTETFSFDLYSIVSKLTYNNSDALVQSAKKVIGDACMNPQTGSTTYFYNTAIQYDGPLNIKGFAQAGIEAHNETLPLQKALLEKAKVDAVDTTFIGCHNAIIASIVAIIVIILVMVIIYLVLRYRRKKKMKKKLQYIKFLEE